ncbi:MAG: phosphomannose isomerase type II C-terminal cupin domain [Acidobacteria bacterium]|nr:phosphomannose isomerase type II C-terminal cupin domain [Acidobacteriota bacterium]
MLLVRRILAAVSFSSKLKVFVFLLMKDPVMESNIAYTENRPWGRFIILDESDAFKVKRIEVSPGKRLSYQRHTKRSEHWYVVAGTAKVTLDGTDRIVNALETVEIPAGAAHRVENPSETDLLVFIEVQTGSYFGEDDIERLSDDFGRA